MHAYEAVFRNTALQKSPERLLNERRKRSLLPRAAQKPVQMRPDYRVQNSALGLVALPRVKHARLTSRAAPPKCVNRFFEPLARSANVVTRCDPPAQPMGAAGAMTRLGQVV